MTVTSGGPATPPPDMPHPGIVSLAARCDTGLSRWLWLVKWLLAIPHLIILVFLWLAFVLASVVAFFAILFTRRYPRQIFDFNLGVLRWTWRVAFYTYGALGTDRYPPFTLGEVADYPATLTVSHPDELSRGLVVVKWWLLAVPHYLVIAFFTRGLVELLTLFAGVSLLFRNRYPTGIFDFVMGMNRWALRVIAYAGLMTDHYPPFRIDLGGAEPPTTHAAAPDSR